ncbi:MAG: phosphatidylserine decarboxylase family protein [Acidobacteria bacterium]|nr:MAG: phosphatidylserine decarboxylase family protein [Acidobacteriota bacterium]
MVKEGYWYASPLVTMAGGLVLLRLYWAASAVLILAIFVLNFFRDPERLISSDPDAIVCPADGRVVEIREESYDGRTVRRVSIFMSPLDVHVNRSPIAGVIEGVRYQKGAFHVASEARASVENEMNVFAVRGSQGVVVVKQIAGVLARRIVFWKKAGDALARGERFGLIKFGSRVDVLLDRTAEVRVRVGERVHAGSTTLARSARGDSSGG